MSLAAESPPLALVALTHSGDRGWWLPPAETAESLVPSPGAVPELRDVGASLPVGDWGLWHLPQQLGESLISSSPAHLPFAYLLYHGVESSCTGEPRSASGGNKHNYKWGQRNQFTSKLINHSGHREHPGRGKPEGPVYQTAHSS